MKTQIWSLTFLCFIACALCISQQQVPIYSQVGCNTDKSNSAPAMCWGTPSLSAWQAIGNLGNYPYSTPSYDWTLVWPGIQTGTKVNITGLVNGVTYEIRTCNSQVVINGLSNYHYTMSFVQYKKDNSGADLAEVPPCCGIFNHAAFVHDSNTYFDFVEVSINLVTSAPLCVSHDQAVQYASQGSGQVNLEIRVQNCPTCNIELSQTDPKFDIHYYVLDDTTTNVPIPSTYADELVPQDTCEYNCGSYNVDYTFSPSQFTCADAITNSTQKLTKLVLTGTNNDYSGKITNNKANCNINVQVYDSTDAKINCNANNQKWYVVSTCASNVNFITVPTSGDLQISLDDLCQIGAGTNFCNNDPKLATCNDNCCEVEGSPSCDSTKAVTGTWNWDTVSTFTFTEKQWQLPGKDGLYTSKSGQYVSDTCGYNLGVIKVWYQFATAPQKVTMYSEIIIRFFSNIPSDPSSITSDPQRVFGVYLQDVQDPSGTLLYQYSVQRNEKGRNTLTSALIKLGSTSLVATTDSNNPYLYNLILRAENCASCNYISAAPHPQIYFTY